MNQEQEQSLDQQTVQGLIDHPRLKNILESLLFVAREPLTVEDAADAIGVTTGAVSAAMQELISEYESRGIKIIKVAGGHLMGTSHENAAFIKGLLSLRDDNLLCRAAGLTLR